MTKRKSGSSYTTMKVAVFAVLFFLMAGMVIFKSGVFSGSSSSDDGLSGLVAVKGTVSAEALGLSGSELKKINRAVNGHKDMFTQVDLFLDAKDGKDASQSSTVLVMAMVLETNGDCEVRSWSRKVSRSDLVPQLIIYMKKAAKEYEQFKKFPDVKQNFKCLYI